MRNSARRDNGFALLLTLLLVMIAGVALVALAQQSTGEALRAVEQTEALQRRWAVTSCRATLLPRTQRLFEALNRPETDADGLPLTDAAPPEPTVHHWVRCRLAGIDYDLVLTDEQAKYNPTAMQPSIGRARNAQALRALADVNPTPRDEQLAVVLRPMVGFSIDGKAIKPPPQDTPGSADDSDNAREPAEPTDFYAHFGQVYDNAAPQALLGSQAAPGPASRVTLWGDGRIRLAHAPDPVVNQFVRQLLGQDAAKQFMQARREAPERGVAGWLAAATSAEAKDMLAAKKLIVDNTDCHGLWVVARGRTRSWHTFSVRVMRPGAPADEQAISPDRAADDPQPENKPGSDPAPDSDIAPAPDTDADPIRNADPPQDKDQDNDKDPTGDDADDRGQTEQDKAAKERGRASPYKRYDYAW